MLDSAFFVLPVICDTSQITSFETFPAPVTGKGIDISNIFAFPHDFANFHFHLDTVCHAVPVTIAECSDEGSIESPDTVGIAFRIEMAEMSFCFMSCEHVKVPEIRDILEQWSEIHSDTVTKPLLFRNRDFSTNAGKPYN